MWLQAILANHYEWLTYDEVNEKAVSLGSGLQALGQQPRKNICIFAETKADWMIAAQACFKYNFPGLFWNQDDVKLKLMWHLANIQAWGWCFVTAASVIYSIHRFSGDVVRYPRRRSRHSWHQRIGSQLRHDQRWVASEIQGKCCRETFGWSSSLHSFGSELMVSFVRLSSEYSVQASRRHPPGLHGRSEASEAGRVFQ